MELPESIRLLFPPEERARLDLSTIKGDASNRQYFRVTGPGGASVVCADPAFRDAAPENYPFLVVRDLFARHGIRVPELLGMAHERGLLLLEDCGDLMMQDEIPMLDRNRLAARYRQIIDLLVRIQSIRPDEKTPDTAIPFSLAFDEEKLMFEFDFFIEHALNGYFRGRLDGRAIAELRGEFLAIARLLVLPEHFVLNHRDFHSRNIMLFRDEPVVIDFQDARLGLPQYDAVSLLRDSYVRLDASLVDELKRYHFEQLVRHELTAMEWTEYLRLFDLMAFQRNVKAVGTFCYQTTVIGNRAFEPCIAPTLGYLRSSIAARPELAAAGRLLEPLIPGTSR
ncbi:aminoglycoside phosphotransferase [Chlorobaculum sp. 24CR]|uniref:aminoglycoside phosphotransferase family protein n=1 Tax=Chlorobaculum sp. 24CR TaxID=2508878 RepID=UPI00100B7295|nr:phosphotransferase [Chlorobaculum sp. 24CR]RXK82277.1 aminoglycoside phosphotransferase [Chlorobaculum sp. 24CR]